MALGALLSIGLATAGGAVSTTPACAGTEQVPASLQVRLEPSDLPNLFREDALARGATGTATAVACLPFAGPLLTCFTVVDGGPPVRRYVTAADLGLWRASEECLRETVLRREAATVTEQRPRWVPVEGDARRYLLSAEGDGLDHVAAFFPERIQARLGGGAFALGVPSRDVLIAFPLGDADLERIVAVGVRRAWETLEHPVSPVVLAWKDGTWKEWGEARPAAPTVPGE